VNECEFSLPASLNNDSSNRLVVTVHQIEELMLWLDTYDPEWYCQKDYTGRLRALNQVGKLSQSFILVKLDSKNQ